MNNITWWLEFAQIDLESAYKKTKIKILIELAEQLNLVDDYDLSKMFEHGIKWESIKMYQKGALEVVNAIKNNAPIPPGRLIINVETEGLSVFRSIEPNVNEEETAIAVMVDAIGTKKGVSIDKFGECKVCGRLFFASSISREKKYCRTQCRNKYHRTKNTHY